MLIKDYMTQDHRDCDEEFAKIEESVSKKDFKEALNLFKIFKAHTLRHFSQEEDLLFVRFSEATGMSGGPIEVMKMEHNQIRGILEQMQNALENNQQEEFFGLSDAMMITLQQHNIKEEQMLYNMIQMQLNSQNDELLEQLKSFPKSV